MRKRHRKKQGMEHITCNIFCVLDSRRSNLTNRIFLNIPQSRQAIRRWCSCNSSKKHYLWVFLLLYPQTTLLRRNEKQFPRSFFSEQTSVYRKGRLINRLIDPLFITVKDNAIRLFELFWSHSVESLTGMILRKPPDHMP